MEDVNITAIMECAHVEVAFIYQVTDPDNKNYLQQTHTCQIVPSGDSSYFNVLQKVQLEVQRSIYYETTPMLNISVKCVDSGNPPLDIVKDFSFTVTECRIGQVGDRNTECLQRNECLSNPCVNHGTCIDGIANYKCKCVSGFTGKRCETKIVYCKDQPCKNKGVCEEQDKKFVCRCSVGFLGRTCDRQPSLCSECSDKEETMCVTFQDTRIRCLGSAYQIPIVNNQGELSTDQLYDIESEIASLLDANFDSLKSRRRRSASRFYVERLQKTGKTDSQVLLVFAALDITNMYKPVKASDACKALANTKYRCPSNSECKAFANKGSSCPRGYKSVAEPHQPPPVNGSEPSGMSPGGIAGIVIGVLVFIVLLVLAVLYYRKKNKPQDDNNGGNRAPNDGAGQRELNFPNPIYDGHISNVNSTNNIYTDISSKSETSDA